MSFDLRPAQRDLRERHRELGEELERELAAHPGPLPAPVWRWCGEHGLLGMPVPREHGGGGLDPLETVLAMEGLGQGCRDLGFLVALHAHLWGTVMPLATLGSEAQRRRFLAPLVDGRWIGAHGITEPDAGSDVHAMAARAARDGDAIVLHGHKHYITNAPRADLVLVYVRDEEHAPDGLSAVLVPRDTPGMERVEQPKLGLDGAPMGEVRLDGCRVPADHLLGRAGAGMAQFSTALEWERACIFAPVLGAMARQLAGAVRHARRRRQFDRPIGRFQSVANRVVDMQLRLDVGRLLLYRVAAIKQGGGRAPMESSEAKLYISEAFVASSLDAMQIRGGAGYLADADTARDLRDAPAGTLFSGTSEIQRVIIARFLGL